MSHPHPHPYPNRYVAEVGVSKAFGGLGDAKLGLNAAALPKLDAEFAEITEAEEEYGREKLKTKWAALEALVGDPKRVKLIIADLVRREEERAHPDMAGQIVG